MKVHTITPCCPHYPSRLRAIRRLAKPLPTLWHRGPLPRGPGLAVVGPRRATASAIAWVEREVACLARLGLTIWSGGAHGIDAAAHRAALAAGGRTVVVTAGSLDRPHPRKHRGLFDEILDKGGAIITQSHFEERANYQFLRRNLVLVALSQAVLAVGSRSGGGTWHSIQTARKLQRPILIVPDAPWNECGRGASDQLARGGVTAVSDAQQVDNALARLSHFGYLPEHRKPAKLPAQPKMLASVQPSATHRLSRAQENLLEVLPAHAEHVDALATRCGLGVTMLRRELLDLQLAGQVVEGPAGHFRRIGHIR